MKVNQYTSISIETIYKEVEKEVYQVELSQEQLDVIVALCGNVIGGGPARELTDSLYEGLYEYTTKNDYGTNKNRFSSYFQILETTDKIVTKE